jgi:Toastrack DUF4097
MRRLLATCAFVAGSFATVTFADEVEVSFAYVPAPNAESMTVEQPLGKLQLRGWDKAEVRIVANKRAPDAKTLDRMRVNVEMKDGHIRVRAGVRVGDQLKAMPSSGRVGIDLTIDAPRKVLLNASTWSGDLEAQGFRAGAQLASRGGEVRASDIEGKVTCNTLKGKQHLSAIHGDVEADGVDGDLELDTVDGETLDAKLVDGQITARRVSTQVVHMYTTSGDIVFLGTTRPGALYVLKVDEGDVRMQLERAPFSILARAGGRVQSGFAVVGQSLPNLLRGDFLGGGAKLELTSVRGNVIVTPH